MKALTSKAVGHERNLVPLTPGIQSNTVCEIYNVVRNRPASTIVRAGNRDDDWYLITPKKENRLEAATFKASGIKKNRQALTNLLDKTGDGLLQEGFLDKNEKRALQRLRLLTMKKGANEDITAGELKECLSPLKKAVNNRSRAEKKAAIQVDAHLSLRDRKDYLKQFSGIDATTKQILKTAMFGHKSPMSLAEQRKILNSTLKLIDDYLNPGLIKKSLSQLIQESPEKDLLLKFADAWLAQTGGTKKMKRLCLMDQFVWKHAVTKLATSIHTEIAKVKQENPLPASPSRIAAVQQMLDKTYKATCHVKQDLTVPPTKNTESAETSSLVCSSAEETINLDHAPKVATMPVLASPEHNRAVTIEDTDSLSEGNQLSRGETEGPYTIYLNPNVRSESGQW